MVSFSCPPIICQFENNKSIKLNLLNPEYKVTFKTKNLGGRKIKMSVEKATEVEITEKFIRLIGGRIKPWEFE